MATHPRVLTFNDNPTEAVEHKKQVLLEPHILVAMLASAFSLHWCWCWCRLSRWMVRSHSGSDRMDGANPNLLSRSGGYAACSSYWNRARRRCYPHWQCWESDTSAPAWVSASPEHRSRRGSRPLRIDTWRRLTDIQTSLNAQLITLIDNFLSVGIFGYAFENSVVYPDLIRLP